MLILNFVFQKSNIMVKITVDICKNSDFFFSPKSLSVLVAKISGIDRLDHWS